MFNTTLKEGGLLDVLEGRFLQPVVDETGLTQRYDFTLPGQPVADPEFDVVNGPHVLGPLGLKVIRAKRKIEVLVVTKAEK